MYFAIEKESKKAKVKRQKKVVKLELLPFAFSPFSLLCYGAQK